LHQNSAQIEDGFKWNYNWCAPQTDLSRGHGATHPAGSLVHHNILKNTPTRSGLYSYKNTHNLYGLIIEHLLYNFRAAPPHRGCLRNLSDNWVEKRTPLGFKVFSNSGWSLNRIALFIRQVKQFTRHNKSYSKQFREGFRWRVRRWARTQNKERRHDSARQWYPVIWWKLFTQRSKRYHQSITRLRHQKKAKPKVTEARLNVWRTIQSLKPTSTPLKDWKWGAFRIRWG